MVILKIAKDYNLNVLKDSLVTCHDSNVMSFRWISSNLIGMNNDGVNTIKKIKIYRKNTNFDKTKLQTHSKALLFFKYS